MIQKILEKFRNYFRPLHPAQKLEKMLGLPPVTWTTRDHRVLLITKMETSHLRNARMFIRETKVKRPRAYEHFNFGEAYAAMGIELDRRGFNLAELESDVKQPSGGR